MRIRNTDGEYGIPEGKCPWCGKVFVIAPYHAYKLGVKLYCSYTCFVRAREAKAEAHRARIEARREAQGKK